MKRKMLLSIISGLCISNSLFFLTGCGCGNNRVNSATGGNNSVAEDIKDGVTNVAEDTKDAVENGVNKLSDKITDTTMDYDSTKFMNDLKSEGYDLKETDLSENYFSVDGKKYTINNDEYIYVYEYDTNAVDALKNDVDLVSVDATKINGKTVNWNKAAHIYKKGRIVVIYDGEDSNILATLNKNLGNPIYG